ncbi:swi5-dependent recombination DNA repair protein 1 homolog [Lytechinus pictus]|uniref:swi5-dependent recombination DNA repair protein 1 homolog n=1 Tax=Lytechinus pictus TaxID=7653 RepID=UPI0030B9D9BF
MTEETDHGKASTVDKQIMEADRTRKELTRNVAEKEESCRKLKLVKMYRSKNDLETLQDLIDKWRDGCQTAILRLYDKHPEPRPSLGDFINSCRLDKDLIRFDEEEETFT